MLDGSLDSLCSTTALLCLFQALRPSISQVAAVASATCTSYSQAMVAGVEVPGDTAMDAHTSPAGQLKQLVQMAGPQGWGELLQQVIVPGA